MEDQDKLIDYREYPIDEHKTNIDSVLTEEEKEIFKKAGEIGREFLNNYEQVKQETNENKDNNSSRRI